jgi:glucosamine 6-phosphate synthetase-like amidotransferase/phosphosugar isomerase protein
VVAHAGTFDQAAAGTAISLPDVPPWAQPVLAIVPVQVASLRLAERRGVQVDAPNGLRNITLTS